MKYKMAIVVRKDLGMSAGKVAVQLERASAQVFTSLFEAYGSEEEKRNEHEMYYDWCYEGQNKVVLQVEDFHQLWKIHIKALNSLPCYIVKDLGYTEVQPNTVTAVALGPDLAEKIDKITGGLKLW